MTTIRAPAVAGTFYPADAAALRSALDALLDAASTRAGRGAVGQVAAIVAPHAAYVYSGSTAACAYVSVAERRAPARRVVLLGPSHRWPSPLLAIPRSDAFATPLGLVAVDADARRTARDLPGVVVADAPHAGEHSLEVQLPFVQRVLGAVAVLPVAVGRAPMTDVVALLQAIWDDDTLVVVSTDLSHYESYDAAAAHDRRTADAICELQPGAIGPDDACGAYPLRGLLAAAAGRGLRPRLLELRSSGDTGGDRRRVVGYGAFALGGAPPPR